jgi:hypothetical protein
MPRRLISTSQLDRIKAAIYDVTETFHRTPIRIALDAQAVARWGGSYDKADRTIYDVLGKAVFGTNTSDAATDTNKGTEDHTRLFITVDTRNLDAVGFPLVDGDLPDVTIGDSYIHYKEKWYKITSAILSGAFDEQSLLARFEVDITVSYQID